MTLFAFDPDRFVELINDKGYDVTWEKSMLCPNRAEGRNVNPGSHNFNCDLCNRSGFLYFEPVETRMIIQSVTLNESYYIQGRFDGGQSKVTALPGMLITYWDRLTLKNGTIRYTELIQRREGSDSDPLRYKTLKALRVQYKDRQFREGVDFEIKDDKIIWTPNEAARPPAGSHYTMAIERRPVYVITDLTHQHRDSRGRDDVFNAMPIQATALLDFLIKDEAKEARAQTRDPFQNDPTDPLGKS